jgi:hypothetical protein
MWYFASFVVFVACVKLLSSGVKPLTVAGIFAGGRVFLALILGGGLSVLLLTAVITGAIAFAYFWLLDRAEGSGAWWVILILGVFLLA